MAKHELWELQQMQSLPLTAKISMTKQRIKAWYDHWDGNVYVSFSGGKDSTVLLDIAREMYPNIKAMFVDVPTQYPELRQFVKTFDNVDIVQPKINFFQVCEKYGFPLFSKEVSECVEGARKYLTRLLEEETVLTDRQTDRQTDRTSIGTTGSADRESMRNPSGGGYDRKYRRLRGIGEFAKRQTEEPQGWEQSTFGNNARNVHERQTKPDKGECP